jgi:plastocyanin
MKSRRTIPVLAAALALALAFPPSVRTADKGKDDDKNKAPQDAIVNFGDPVTLAGAGNQVLVPDDTTISKGGTITFVVNGGGHGIAIYPVSKNTTREDITQQLCMHDPVTNACVDPAFANADHTIRDGKDNVVIVTGTNPPFLRIDDPTDRLLATSTQIGNLAGAFLTGTTATATGTLMQVRFAKTGRYLAVCMNRSHYLASWMFGFISVVGDDDN